MQHALIYWLVSLAGALTAKMEDPLTWVLVGVVAIAGYNKISAWCIPVAALVATAVNVIAVYSWWVELGLAHQWIARARYLLLLHAIVALLSYLIGRLVRWMGPAPKSA